MDTLMYTFGRLTTTLFSLTIRRALGEQRDGSGEAHCCRRGAPPFYITAPTTAKRGKEAGSGSGGGGCFRRRKRQRRNPGEERRRRGRKASTGRASRCCSHGELPRLGGGRTGGREGRWPPWAADSRYPSLLIWLCISCLLIAHRYCDANRFYWFFLRRFNRQ
jgi:hypothetical protein